VAHKKRSEKAVLIKKRGSGSKATKKATDNVPSEEPEKQAEKRKKKGDRGVPGKPSMQRSGKGET